VRFRIYLSNPGHLEGAKRNANFGDFLQEFFL